MLWIIVQLSQCSFPCIEHFVYQPKRCTANAGDIPFFLSTRLADAPAGIATTTSSKEDNTESNNASNNVDAVEDPERLLQSYEILISDVTLKYENSMTRF